MAYQTAKRVLVEGDAFHSSKDICELTGSSGVNPKQSAT